MSNDNELLEKAKDVLDAAGREIRGGASALTDRLYALGSAVKNWEGKENKEKSMRDAIAILHDALTWTEDRPQNIPIVREMLGYMRHGIETSDLKDRLTRAGFKFEP